MFFSTFGNIKPYQSLAYLVYYWSQRGAGVITVSRSGEPSKQSDPAELKLLSITADW